MSTTQVFPLAPSVSIIGACLVKWHSIKARLSLAGLRCCQIKRDYGENRLSISCLVLQREGFSNASESYHNEVKAIIDNTMEGSSMVHSVEWSGLKLYLTIVMP